MPQINVAIVVALIVGAIVVLIGRRTAGQPLPAVRATVGIIAGVLGALVILTSITDLIPDVLETAIGPIGVTSLTVALVLLTAWKLAS